MASWLPWTFEIFSQARTKRKAVLLFLPSAGPRTLEDWERAWASPFLAAALERFVLIAVTAQERPDVQARYGMGREQLLVLDCEGEVITGFGYGNPDALGKALGEISDRYQQPAPSDVAARASWTGAVGQSKTAGLQEGFPRTVLGAVLAERAGLSVVPGALDLLLYAAREWGDREAKARLLLELSELSSLRDKKSGAFCGPAGALLGLNAELARLYWDAFAFLAEPLLRDTAAGVTAFLLRELFDASAGAFRQAPGMAEPLFYAECNAKAAYALLRASAFPGDGRRLQAATQTLVFLQTQVFEPSSGMLRRPGGEMGQLGDHAWTALAFSESFLMSGQRQHREFADGLMRSLFQEFWDRDNGGFLDRAPEPGAIGRLRVARRPVQENAAAFEALWRLHHLKGNANYRKWLDWGLSSLSAGPASVAAAPLGRVQDMMARGRMELELVGRPGETKTDALLAALHRNYLPRKIVSFVDPDDQDYILAHKLGAASYPRLFGCLDMRPKAEASEPGQVLAVLAALTKT